MKLIEFEVDGLFNKEAEISIHFNEDINILTGKNGAGKTSILKLLWYIISGNIILATQEVNFRSCRLLTTDYEIKLYRISRFTCKVEFTKDGTTLLIEDLVDDEDEILSNAEDEANPLLIEHGNSLFLPTFRRIEGGFTLTSRRPRTTLGRTIRKNEIEEAVQNLARRLSNEPHLFVSSISTDDIVELLLGKYTNLSEKYTDLQQETSENIIAQIKAYKSDATDVKQIDAANYVLDEIRKKIEAMERQREEIMNPITAVQALVKKIFQHSGIKIGTRLSFGDAARAVNSDLLSAGEKQMLSFICYNAFRSDSVIFIDEPELSLHIDWQRQLFSILKNQQSSNQFVVATHSPFIYSKYPDKEIVINYDRGDTEPA